MGFVTHRLMKCMFICLLFDLVCALGPGKWFQIERRQVAFLWWDQDSKLWVSGTQTPADVMRAYKRTELSGIKLKKFEPDSPSFWWARLQHTWRHCRNWFIPGSGDIRVCCLIFIRKYLEGFMENFDLQKYIRLCLTAGCLKVIQHIKFSNMGLPLHWDT